MKLSGDFSEPTVRFIGAIGFIGAFGLILPAVTGIAPRVLMPTAIFIAWGRFGEYAC